MTPPTKSALSTASTLEGVTGKRPKPATATTGGTSNSTREQRARARRVSKGQIERKRRARINRNLNELKSFLVQDGSHVFADSNINPSSKLDKADILEFSVKYMRTALFAVGSMRSSREPTGSHRAFLDGFLTCAMQLIAMLDSDAELQELHAPTKQHVHKHLLQCVDDARRTVLDGGQSSDDEMSAKSSSTIETKLAADEQEQNRHDDTNSPPPSSGSASSASSSRDSAVNSPSPSLFSSSSSSSSSLFGMTPHASAAPHTEETSQQLLAAGQSIELFAQQQPQCLLPTGLLVGINELLMQQQQQQIYATAPPGDAQCFAFIPQQQPFLHAPPANTPLPMLFQQQPPLNLQALLQLAAAAQASATALSANNNMVIMDANNNAAEEPWRPW